MASRTRLTVVTLRLRGWDAITVPDGSSTTTLARSARPSSAATSCGPPLTTARVIRGCARDARSTASYCSAAMREPTRCTTAANGVRNGISSSGSPSSSAADTSSSGTSSKVSPVPNPTPATPLSWRRRRYCRRSAAAGGRLMPVVSTSSPPDSHLAGSANSVVRTKLISPPTPAAPPRSRIRRSAWSSTHRTGTVTGMNVQNVEKLHRKSRNCPMLKSVCWRTLRPPET